MRLAAIPAARPRVFLAGLFVLALALDVLDASTHPGRWYGWFPGTVHSVENLNRFGDVVTGCAAAALAGTARRAGLSPWGGASVRSRGEQVRALLAAAVGPVLAAHVVVGGSMLALTTHRDGSRGMGWWALLALGAGPALTVAWAAAGALLGLRLPRILALPLAAVLPFAVVALLDVELLHTPVAALTYASSGSFTWSRPGSLTLVARFATFLALALLGWAVAARWRRRTVYAWGASLSLAGAFVVGPSMVDIPGADEQTCSGSAPRICLSGAYEAARPTYRAFITEAWASLPTPLRRNTIVADGPDRPGALAADITDGRDSSSLLPDRAASIAALGDAAWPTPNCEVPADDIDSLAFQAWWLHRFSIPTDGTGPLGTNLEMIPEFPAAQRQAQALARMTPAQRDAWVVHAIGPGLRCIPGTQRPPS